MLRTRKEKIDEHKLSKRNESVENISDEPKSDEEKYKASIFSNLVPCRSKLDVYIVQTFFPQIVLWSISSYLFYPVSSCIWIFFQLNFILLFCIILSWLLAVDSMRKNNPKNFIRYAYIAGSILQTFFFISLIGLLFWHNYFLDYDTDLLKCVAKKLNSFF